MLPKIRSQQLSSVLWVTRGWQSESSESIDNERCVIRYLISRNKDDEWFLRSLVSDNTYWILFDLTTTTRNCLSLFEAGRLKIYHFRKYLFFFEEPLYHLVTPSIFSKKLPSSKSLPSSNNDLFSQNLQSSNLFIFDVRIRKSKKSHLSSIFGAEERNNSSLQTSIFDIRPRR